MNDHEQEADLRWGETDAYRESNRRWQSYTDDDKAEMQTDLAQVVDAMATLFKNGVAPQDKEARQVAEQHRLHIERWFYRCSPWMHAELSQMYLYDERFSAFFDKHVDGLSTFFSDAIEANTLESAGEPMMESALNNAKSAAGIAAADANPLFKSDLLAEEHDVENQVNLQAAAQVDAKK